MLRVAQRNKEILEKVYCLVCLEVDLSHPINLNLNIIEGVRLSQLQLTMRESKKADFDVVLLIIRLINGKEWRKKLESK